jgi:hypothetical protein
MALRIVLLLSAAAAGLHAQPTAYPYLIKGVDFHVTADGVRMREQPNTTSRIMQSLRRETGIIPLQVSDHSEVIGGEEAFFWYRCALQADRGIVGWIYGRYIGCRLETHDDWLAASFLGDRRSLGPEIAVPPAEKGADLRKEAWLVFYYSFLDGVFTKGTAGTLSRHVHVGDQFAVHAAEGPAGTEAARVTVTDVSLDEPEHARTELTRGGIPQNTWLAMVGGNIAVSTERRFRGSDGMAGDLLDAMHQYACGELAAAVGAPVDFHDVEVATEDSSTFPVLDNGEALSSDVSYYRFLGSLRNWWLRYTCFVIRHPDGTVVRSNIDFALWDENDRSDEAMSANNAMVSWTSDSATEFGALPTSIINLEQERWKGWKWYAALTNGYVVFTLGLVADIP